MYFFEPTHKYYKNNVNEVTNFISASKIPHLYGNPFDSEYWSLYKAYELLAWRDLKGSECNIDEYLANKPQELKDYFKKIRQSSGYKLNDYNLFNYLRCLMDEKKALKIQKYIKDGWNTINKVSLDKGHTYHDGEEKSALAKEFVINPFTGNKLPVIHCNKWISNTTKVRTVDLSNLKDGFYAELIINWGDRYIGQADLVYIEDGYLYIDDYKTNKKLNFDNRFQKMLSPISHLDDCNWEHYKLQLSFYIWMLSKYGYKCKGSKITYCELIESPDGDKDLDYWKQTNFPFEHYTKEIEDIINDIEQHV